MASGPTIIARFIADTSKLESDVEGAGSRMQSGLSSFASKAALAVGGAFAVSEVVQFGKAIVEAAAADAEAQAKLATTLKNVTGATDAQVASNEDFISKLSTATAIADDDLRPAMSDLVRGFGDAESAQKALSLATDISAGTGKDLGSVSGALMKAAMGQTTALKKLGVETTNADGSAKSLEQIMGDLSGTFQGQAAGAAESTAGQMRSAEIAMGEFQETIGTAVLPVLGKLATFLTSTLLPALTAVFGWISDHKEIVLMALAGIAAAFVWVAVGAVAAAIPVGVTFTAWVVGALAAAAATLLAAAPFVLIGIAVAGLAILIIKNWDWIKETTAAVWGFIKDAVETAFNWIRDNWPLLLAIITGPIGIAVLLVVRNWDTIKDAVMTAFNWVKDNWPLLLAIITGPIGMAVLLISRNWDTIKEGASAVLEWIKGIFNGISDAISGVVGGIASAIGRVVSAIKDPINALIRAWNGLSFKVPSFSIPEVDTHIPGIGKIGGGTFGGQTFNFPDLPTLASGGVLTSPTLFLGGEAGTEIVAPEDMLRAIVREEGGRGNYTLNLTTRTADAADIAYGFRRLELMAGVL